MSGIIEIINGTLTGAAGVAQGREGTTVSTFVISLGSGFVLFTVQFSIFLVIRNYLWSKRIYQPRSFLVPVKQRIQPPNPNPFKWMYTVFKIKEDPDLLEKAGMDAYFFIRYLSMLLKIFFPTALIIIPILLPVNYNGGKGRRLIDDVQYDIRGLDLLAWSNVSPENTNRYWAHLFLAIIFIVWVFFIFHYELKHYIQKRHEYLGSAAHRLRASSTTVLVTDIPEKLCNDAALMEMYNDFPGGVRRIWINRNLKSAVEIDNRRREIEDALENAETDLLRKAIKRQRKLTRKGQSNIQQPSSSGDESPMTSDTPLPDSEAVTRAICERDLQYDLKTKASWTEYLLPKHRPKMRIIEGKASFATKIPIFGRFFKTKVDTIYYCRRELAHLNKQLATEIATPEKFPLNGSAFIQFNTQKAAHMACQAVADVAPKHMKRRIVEISPADINWGSLDMTWRSRYFRVAWFLVLFILLLLGFGLVAFFTGILSRADTLQDSTSWLSWIGSLPRWLVSFIQGTLPPLIQVIVLSGPLPILIRSLTNNTKGAYTGQEGERSLQMWYLIFLLVELLIIPTISSGLTTIVTQLIQQPTGIPNILATNLPTASNYYFSFLIVQVLSLSATSLLQTIRLFNFYVLGRVNTPDSVYEKLTFTHLTRIGSNIPWYTTFAVIGMVYSVVAPLILIFMLITFSVFWFVIKNQVLWVVRTGIVDGGALWFPRAVNQTFIGLYFLEVCLIGLFFLVRDTNDNVACDPQGIIMAFVLVITILYQIWLSVHLGRLYKFAPIRLELESANLLVDSEEDLPQPPTEPPTSADAQKQKMEEKEDVMEMKELKTAPATQAAEDDKLSNLALPPRRATIGTVHSQYSRNSRDMQAQQVADAKAAKGILARLNAPLDEARLGQLEKVVEQAERKIGNVLMPRRRDIETKMMDDPISKIMLQHNDELETLDAEERDMLVSIAFTHPVLRAPRPCVWIPRDELGISDDEVRRTRALTENVDISNEGAGFDAKLKVVVDKPPPDLDQFSIVMKEL